MPILPTASPTTQHLVPPPSRPRGRMSSIVNTVIAVLSLVIIFTLGTGWITNASFFRSRYHPVAKTGSPGAALAFQGFHDVWLRKWGDHQFTQDASRQVLRSEADDYHMNAVAIQITADQNTLISTSLSFASTDQGNADSLPDADIEQAITDALAVGLTPILTLNIQVTNDLVSSSSTFIGYLWNGVPGEKTIGTAGQVASAEHQWFDSYTAFAVHYAQLSQKHHLPYFIFGNDLVNITTDTAKTGPKTTGASAAPGETFTCSGRRDCAWRHVVNAIKSANYTDYQGKQQTGGGYTGKLIYGASWGGADNAQPEFEHITWWDAVDIIGVSAYFPLTKNVADVPVQTLIDAWHGKKDDLDLSDQGDIIGRLNAQVEKYKHPILFTSAGYESIAGSNTSPGATTIACGSGCRDDVEQEHDMEALLKAFNAKDTPWFVGVLWSFDEPKWPRSSVDGWATSTAWAGDTITGNGPGDAKAGGKFLAQFYQQRPVSEQE
jgi:hypothetical protein